jgi:hypothetical protein
MLILTRHTFWGYPKTLLLGKNIFLLALSLLFLQAAHIFQTFHIADISPRISLALQVYPFWILLLLTVHTLNGKHFLFLINTLFFILFFIFYCALRFLPMFIISSLPWFPVALFVINAFFLNLAQKYPDPMVRGFAHALQSGSLFLGLSMLIQNFFIHPLSPIIIASLTACAHFQFCTLFQNFFSLRKKEEAWTLWSDMGAVLIFAIPIWGLLTLFFGPSPFLILGSLVLFLVLLKILDYWMKRFTYGVIPSLNDYLERLEQCQSYLKTLLKIPEFLAFLSGVFGEFFESKKIFILILYENDALGFRILSLNKDQTFRLPEETRHLKSLFSSKNSFHWNMLDDKETQDPNSILSNLKKNENLELLIKIQNKGPNLYLLGFSPGNLSTEQAFHISTNSALIGETLDHILLFELKKTQCFEQLQQESQKLDIEELKKQNLTLQQAFEKVRRMQTELIHKEKQAALTKFSISLDDEISNPLNNILIAMQYHLEKTKLGETDSASHREKTLDIIITQSLRIKETLEKIRNLTDKPRASKENPLIED